MSKSKLIIFDLDGTIADTLYAVIRIYNQDVAGKLGCKKVRFEDKSILQNQPIRQVFKDYQIPWYKLPVVIYKVKKILQKQIHTIQAFQGMQDVLLELKARNYSLGIVTSNSQKNAKAFLDLHQFSKYFDFVYTNRNIFSKHKTLNWVLKKHNFQKQQVVYIGDETRDIHAARKARIGIIAVTWGYLGAKILAERKPDFLIHHPSELIVTIEQFYKGKCYA